MREEVEEAVRNLKAGNLQEWMTFPPSCLEWRRVNNNSPDSDMPEDLGDKGVDTIARHLFKERQPQAMLELSYYWINQPSLQDHAPSYPQLIGGQGCGTACRRTRRV